MEKHKELKKILVDYNIVSDNDYIRTFDENNFTDFSLNKVDRIINEESKYILIGLSKKDSKPFALFNPQLSFIHNEIYQNMIYNEKVYGYNKERNRVLGYYEGNGIIRFGNKVPNQLKLQFEHATIDDIIRKKYYIQKLPNNKRHEIIQSYLLNLGESLGYEVHFALNDRKKINKLNSNLLIAKTPLPGDLIAKTSKKVIDLIDVIWLDGNYPISAIEIEFSNNFADALRRLHSLNDIIRYMPHSLYNIICSEDYFRFYQFCKNNSSFILNLFPNFNLYHLSLTKLDDCLKLKDLLGFGNEKNVNRKHFFNQSTLRKICI